MSAAAHASPPLVVLIPGLWMPAWVMLPLARRLAVCGFRCARFGYASMRASLDENARRLGEFIAGLGTSQVHLVGHSLGGVLALYATAVLQLHHVRRIVLIGSPYAGSHAARRLARWSIGRRLLGCTVPDWLGCAKPPVPQGVEVGVVAGTVGIGLGALVVPDLPRPHDGVVSLVETAVPGAAADVCVGVNHSAMLVSAQVARCVCLFLRHGRFQDSALDGPGNKGAGMQPPGRGVTP